MSSLIRRLEKRIMKARGLFRNSDGDIENAAGDIVRKAPRDKEGRSVGKASWPK